MWLLFAASALWSVLGVLGLLPAMFSPMLFDAPGSTSSLPTIMFAIGVLAFPLACFASVVGMWAAYSRGNLLVAYRWCALPLGCAGWVAAAMIWLNLAQAGSLAG